MSLSEKRIPMPTRHTHSILTSVFSKLLVIILLAGLGINLALVLLFGVFRHHIAGSYQPHLIRYVDYLVKELGTPPDPTRARRIASQTHLVIAYNTPSRSWTTAQTPLDLPVERFRLRHQSDNIRVSGYHGILRVVVQLDDGRLTFILPHQADAEKKLHILGIGLLLYVTLLMIGAYLAIRRILKPLRWLRQGVGEVAKGELTHRVPDRRSDELGELAAAFNTMTDRIGKLIQAKERLLLDVSHELRTPLTRMKVALAMMEPGSCRQSLEEDLREMDHKITELLESARAVKIKADLDLGKTDLAGLVKKTAAVMSHIPPGIRMLDEPSELFLPLDAHQMDRAIRNIIDNALKYSPRDGRPVEISLKYENFQAVIQVSDHGAGIPAEDLDFIFEPFYRVDKSRTDGYGLGLSMAKTIIEAHGGNIAITSTPQLGTTVRIALPVPDKNHQSSVRRPSRIAPF